MLGKDIEVGCKYVVARLVDYDRSYDHLVYLKEQRLAGSCQYTLSAYNCEVATSLLIPFKLQGVRKNVPLYFCL